MKHELKITIGGESSSAYPIQISIDNKELKNLTYFSFKASADEMPECTCEFCGIPDIATMNEAEPIHAHWKESDIPCEEYVCSNCGGACWYLDYEGDVAKSNYCPNCGAKMDE